jgi:hypothetical protein
MKNGERQEALFIRSFKTKRLDGHSVRTVYALVDNGVVNIERRMISTKLNDGFKVIRVFGKYIYQCETMVFKLTSFMTIANSVREYIPSLKINDIVLYDEILFNPNEKILVELFTKSKQL